jgi:hypothetical protein
VRELTPEQVAALRGVAADATRQVLEILSPHTDEADPLRPARLMHLEAASHLIAAVTDDAAALAQQAAQAGADYSEMAAAAGLASRQLASYRWPGLAPITKQAREQQRAARNPS